MAQPGVGDAASLRFCIRDDDTNFFTRPEDLERIYGGTLRRGPVSLAVVPFCRAGSNKAVPAHLRDTWSLHPLHDNPALVEYLREKVGCGQFEIMLHGYHHDEADGRPEFEGGSDLERKARHGRQYLQDLLDAPVRVFVPPHNGIGSRGLRAIARAGLHLAGAAGMRGGWPVTSRRSWALWWKLRALRRNGGVGVPWGLDLGDHREIGGNPVTPLARLGANRRALECERVVGGVFCAATHYWELDTPSEHPDDPTVGDHLRDLIDRALSRPGTVWQSVGDVVSTPGAPAHAGVNR